MAADLESKDVKKEKQESKVTTTKKVSISINLVLIAVLVTFLFAAAGGYWLWRQQVLINQQLNALTVTAKPSIDPERVNTLSINQASLSKQLEDLKLEQQQLNTSVSELAHSQSLKRGDVQRYWSLAEIQYLLSIANQRLYFAADITGAQQALALADKMARKASMSELNPLRALIAKEQLALSSTAQPDIDGFAFKLASAIEEVDSLQVLMAPPVNGVIEAPAASTMDQVKSTLDKAWHEIKSLVVIRKQQNGAAAVLIPEQRYFLYQNLRLKLETARFALLSGREAVFKSSLLSAEQWLKQYFVGSERDALLSLVSEMQQQSIETKLPDISQSLAWIKGFEK